jgi:hypothetical protein
LTLFDCNMQKLWRNRKTEIEKKEEQKNIEKGLGNPSAQRRKETRGPLTSSPEPVQSFSSPPLTDGPHPSARDRLPPPAETHARRPLPPRFISPFNSLHYPLNLMPRPCL